MNFKLLLSCDVDVEKELPFEECKKQAEEWWEVIKGKVEGLPIMPLNGVAITGKECLWGWRANKKGRKLYFLGKRTATDEFTVCLTFNSPVNPSCLMVSDGQHKHGWKPYRLKE